MSADWVAAHGSLAKYPHSTHNPISVQITSDGVPRDWLASSGRHLNLTYNAQPVLFKNYAKSPAQGRNVDYTSKWFP